MNPDLDIANANFIRVCDCNNGRWITTLTKQEIEYIFDAVTKYQVTSGDFIEYAIAEDALEKLGEIREYVVKEDRNQ